MINGDVKGSVVVLRVLKVDKVSQVWIWLLGVHNSSDEFRTYNLEEKLFLFKDCSQVVLLVVRVENC